MASQITSLTSVYSTVIQAQIKENIKAPHHWPLCGEFTGTGEFSAQRASNVENVSIWWRHHDLNTTRRKVVYFGEWESNGRSGRVRSYGARSQGHRGTECQV